MRILDLTAGRRAIWMDKNNPLATFLDIRPEMKPDIVCDTRAIPEIVGTGFNLVVYDPPHVNCGPTSDFGKRYGHFTTVEILNSIEETAIEAHRVSLPGALMAFKWNDHDIKLPRVMAYLESHWTPLFGDVSKFLKRGSQTYWVMLLRKDL